mgnify:CR=1 FL=1
MNPKIAFYYEDGRRINRNDGPPLYWWNAARELFGKENVAHSIPNGKYPDGQERFDHHIWVDWGEDALMSILDYTPKTPPSPNIYVCSDAHIGYDYRLSRAREFDFVFCNQLRCCEEFVRDGIPKEKVFWLPHAVEPKAYPTKSIIKRYDVCFVGNINGEKRVDFLDRMFKEFPNFFWGKRLFEEAAEVFSSSRIVLNSCIGDDINMRIFEALATKSLLLTEWLPTLDHLFQDGVHLVTYKTLDEAVEKARYYIAHPDEAQAIAERGYEEVMAKHTYQHRVRAALELVKARELVKA